VSDAYFTMFAPFPTLSTVNCHDCDLSMSYQLKNSIDQYLFENSDLNPLAMQIWGIMKQNFYGAHCYRQICASKEDLEFLQPEYFNLIYLHFNTHGYFKRINDYCRQFGKRTL